jgi:uncharacterized Tic20 family protein
METQLNSPQRYQMPETGLNPNHGTHDLSRFAWFRRPRNKIYCVLDKLQRLLLLDAVMLRGTVLIRAGIKNNDITQDIQIKNKQLNYQIMKTQLIFLRWMLVLLFAAGSMTVMGQSSTDDPDHACVGSTQDYWVIPTLGSTYNWVLSGGGTINSGNGTAAIQIIWGAISGSYTLTVTETLASTTGCSGDAVILTIIVDPLPTPVISGPATVCQNDAGVIYSTPPVAGNTYVWVVTGGIVTAGAGTNQITVTWTTAGLGSVQVTESITATSCATTVSIPVQVNAKPVTSPIWHN